MNNEVKIPNHVAIILDGNGRWAKERGMTRSQGHEAGFKNLTELSEYIFKRGVKVLSVFAFSTENFKRSKAEVDFLMNLFANKFYDYRDRMSNNNIKIVFSGNKTAPLPDKVIKMMYEIEESTKDNTGGIFNICINYGGHLEIVNAVKKVASLYKEDEISIDDITEENLYHYMFQDLPPVDLLIRTSGEVRISNFMLYQLSYSEMIFTNTYFPAFNSEEFEKSLIEYTSRDRRFGGIKDEDKNN